MHNYYGLLITTNFTLETEAIYIITRHIKIVIFLQMFGLPGLLCTISAGHNEDSPPLQIYGPVGLRQFVRVALNLARSQLDYSYVVHELVCDIHPGDYDGKVRV